MPPHPASLGLCIAIEFVHKFFHISLVVLFKLVTLSYEALRFVTFVHYQLLKPYLIALKESAKTFFLAALCCSECGFLTKLLLPQEWGILNIFWNYNDWFQIFFFFNVYLGFKFVLSFYVVGYHIGTLSLLFYILECLHQKSWLIPLMYWWHLNHSLWRWLLLAYLEDFYKFNASSISLFACKLQIVFSSKLAHQLVHKWDAGFAIF